MSITVQNVHKRFGGFVALGGVSLDVKERSLTALLGPSGSGKSTLLRAIAGLDQPDTGTVTINGRDVTNVPPQRRGIGFVFQHYAAFKHLTVRDNVAFGLKIRRRPKSEIKDKVDNLLDVVGLSGFQTRYPNQLSGGQRQRMALARALAVDPQVLLLDEPFGALDAKVRQELRRWLRRLHAEIHLTSVFVTHDQEEALELANRVVVMNEGRIEQDGTPEDVVEHPATPFVVNFLGQVNIFHGRVQDGQALFGPMAVAFPEHPHTEARTAAGYSRPHELAVSRTDEGGGLWAIVTDVRVSGAIVKMEVTDDQRQPMQVELGREQYEQIRAIIGEKVYVKPRKVRVFMEDPSP